jgi:biotin transporter BioY
MKQLAMVVLRLILVGIPIMSGGFGAYDWLLDGGRRHVDAIDYFIFPVGFIWLAALTMAGEFIILLLGALILHIVCGGTLEQVADNITSMMSKLLPGLAPGQPTAAPSAAYGTLTPPANEHVRLRKEQT